MSDDAELSEAALASMIGRIKGIAVPELTPARLEAVRALLPAARRRVPPSLTVSWTRLADEARNVLAVLKSAGFVESPVPAPLLRGGKDAAADILAMSCAVDGGEAAVRVTKADGRAFAVLSVRGERMSDLSAEVSCGGKLVEARPMEKRVDLALRKPGAYRIRIFSGKEMIGEFDLDLLEEGAADHV